MDKKTIINDLYQVAIISILAIGCSMLGKKIAKITPPSVQKFDLEDMGKLVAIVAASEMMGVPHQMKNRIGTHLKWPVSQC